MIYVRLSATRQELDQDIGGLPVPHTVVIRLGIIRYIPQVLHPVIAGLGGLKGQAQSKIFHCRSGCLQLTQLIQKSRVLL